MTVLDASLLIATMQPADAHHRDAVNIIRRSAVTGALAVHPITLAESAVGAAQRDRLDQLRDAFARLGLIVMHPDAEQPWRLAQLRARTGLPLPDCCVLDTAVESSDLLATFDERLAARARDLGVPLVTSRH